MISTANRIQHIEEYYFSKKLRAVKALENEGNPVINLGIGNPDLLPPKQAIDEVKNLMNSSVHGYQSYQGIPQLKESILSFSKQHYNINLGLGEVLPLMGSKEGIMHITMAFLNENEKVLIPNPGYPTYESVTKLLDGKVIKYHLKSSNNWLPDLAEIEKNDLSEVKLMWINYPNMPTGAKSSFEMFEKLIQFANKHQILIVNDNPYSFILNEKFQSILQVKGAKEVALELNSVSKTFNMAGWRIGWVSGNEKFIKAILKVKSNMDSGMFFGLQKGASLALKSDSSWFENLNKIYTKRRKLVWEIADLLKCSYDKSSSGLFVWAKLPNGIDDKKWVDEILYSKYIFITPGSIFGTNGSGYIRISLCVPEEKIKEALNRLKSKI
ncbi:MAG: pyridoxal phosphate-dependent aminotransferase [Lutibacter sp.]